MSGSPCASGSASNYSNNAMLRYLRLILLLIALPAASEELSPLVNRPWFEAQTAHFNLFSCGKTQEVSLLAARLEQFRLAYLSLAGVQAVASPPIIVLGFPDRHSMAAKQRPVHLRG